MIILVGILLVVVVGVLIHYYNKKISEIDNELEQYGEKDEWYKWIRLKSLLEELQGELTYRNRRLKISRCVFLITFFIWICSIICIGFAGWGSRFESDSSVTSNIAFFGLFIWLIALGFVFYYSCGLLIRKYRIWKYNYLLGELKGKYMPKER